MIRLALAMVIIIVAATYSQGQAHYSEQGPPGPPVQEVSRGVQIPENDIYLLASLIHTEARGEPYIGKVAVGAVVINRVTDNRWPQNIKDVIKQPGQFCSSSNLLKPSDDSFMAAIDALSGQDPTRGALYFYNPDITDCEWIKGQESVIRIGHHDFAR